MTFKRFGAVIGLTLGTIYLMNPGWGVFEILPDNLPGVGNLDEGAAAALVLWALKTLRTPRHQPPNPPSDQTT